jgi:hypothetical protein
MRAFTLLFLLFSCSGHLFGQTVITGHLRSPDQAALADVNVLVHPKNQPTRLISFSISDSKGNFRLEFSSSDDSIGISTRSMAYRDTTIWVANQNQELTIILPVHVNEIRQVNVNSRPITAKKDTITYLVSAFATAKDQSIGDVIAKMPGFEVNSDGQVFYQGNPIQKYYIEGMDLLENRYAIANKNLPHGVVGSVEVLENHQPIKALESEVFSNRTSLNLKLKKNVALTGTARTGTGLPWLLRDVNVTPMLFNARQQVIASLQSNNIGDDLNMQNQPLQFSNGILDGANKIKPQLLEISSLNKPQIERQRYLDNNANLISYNHLVKINALNELKINAGYYHDLQHESGSKTSMYYLPEGTYTLNEINNNRFYNSGINTNFTLTQNTANRYLKEQFGFNRHWDHSTGTIQNPEIQTQKAETPNTSFSNTFDLLIPYRKNFFRIYSSIVYNNSPQTLNFYPGVFEQEFNGGSQYSETEQNYRQESIDGKQFFRFTSGRNAWSFETETGLNFNVLKTNTYIRKDGQQLLADSLNNKYRWSSYELYLTESFRYEKNDFRMRLELPVRGLFYQMNDEIRSVTDRDEQLTLSPSMFVSYDPNAYWSGSISARYNSTPGNPDQLTPGYILTSYRELQRQSDKLNGKKTLGYVFNLKYKNPVSGFFSSVLISHSQTTNNLLYRNSLTGSGLYFFRAIETRNRSFSDNFSVENGWYLARARTTVKLKGLYNAGKREYLLNELKGWLNTRFYSIGPSVNVGRWQQVVVDYGLEFNYITQRNLQADIKITEQKHKMSLYFYPTDRQWLGLDLEYYHTRQEQQKTSNPVFANLTYSYKPQNSRLQFKLKCANILNRKEIIQYYYSDISLVQDNYRIRPREIMFSFSFSLNRYKNKN